MNESTDTAQSISAGAAVGCGTDPFALLSEHSLSGVFIIEGRTFSHVNPRFCELLGRGRADLLGLRNALDVVDKDMRVRVEKAIDALHEAGAGHQTMDVVINHGQLGPIPFRVNLVAQPEAAKPTILGSVLDTGETDRLKESLKHAEERFRYAARATQELIWECNLANNRLWCNESILTVFKRPPEKAPKNLGQLVDCAHPDDREDVRAGLKMLGSGAKPLWLHEFRFQRGDGSWADVVARAFVLFDSDRKPIRLIGSIFDNSMHRTMESRLMEAQRLSSLGAMANGLAHDVNNLLTPILTAAQRLKEDVFIDEHQTALIESIENNCRRGADLAGELMKFGDGQSGGTRSLRINKLIDSVVHIFRETFPRNIYVAHHAADDLHKIRADELQIDQVLMNLCIHARDQMPDGGELRITAENVVLDAQFALACKRIKPGAFIKIQVRDTGLGYTASELKSLFDPSKENRSEQYLGLVTVDSIVEKLGGDIVVSSHPGKWTSFDVYLPALDDEPGEREVDESAPPANGNGELILLVDDEPEIRELTRETLEHHGYSVVTATDGADAVTIYCQRRNEIALVLMDLKMPVMDGVTAIQVLHGINPRIRIVATTGSFASLELASSPAHKIDGMLRKPYTNAKLLAILGEVVNRR